MIEQKIRHYRITEKLGEGGMGVVYKAEDTELDRKVAVKFLQSHHTADEEGKARFKREAQAAAALNHPNIITIHEISELKSRSWSIQSRTFATNVRSHCGGKRNQPDRQPLKAAQEKQVLELDDLLGNHKPPR